MVGAKGFEPSTPCSRIQKNSNNNGNLALFFGVKRLRTFKEKAQF